jgi:hypothetical protein
LVLHQSGKRFEADQAGRGARPDFDAEPENSPNVLIAARKNPLSKSANHRNMPSVVNSRKEVIQCLVVFSPA